MSDEADDERERVMKKRLASQSQDIYRTDTHRCLKPALDWILADVALSVAIPQLLLPGSLPSPPHGSRATSLSPMSPSSFLSPERLL